MSGSIEVRVLSTSDLQMITEIHMKAFPDSALMRLGREAVLRYYLWQMTGPHDSVNIGAFKSDNLIGFCFGGIFRGALGGFLDRNRGFLIRQVLTHPWLLFDSLFRERAWFACQRLIKRFSPLKSRQLETTTKQDPRSIKHFGILSIAVEPHYHGQGIAQQLMEYVEHVARERGFTQMALTVHPSNGRAIRFYEKLDWQRDSAKSAWTGRMTKCLTAHDEYKT